jgi:uncharacterized Fe-S cluster-containing radical SAM superfamily protein
MVSLITQPHVDNVPDGEQYCLTLVLPAANGCNLKCPFCLIDQREEIAETHLRPDDYARFVEETSERFPIFAVGIQGYEPLLPEAVPYTKSILAAGQNSDVKTTLVTNGVFLSDTVEMLAALPPSKIAVSIDGASAHIHDRVRGVAGAWEASVKGIRRAIEILTPQTRVAVNSVLLPSKRQYLDDMPARLADMGIDDWIITPLIRIGSNQIGGPIDRRNRIVQDLIRLQEAADLAGIRFTVDDEFDHLGREADEDCRRALRSLSVRTLPKNVELIRMTPSGQCSVGADVLKKMPPDAPRWRPGDQNAGDFIALLDPPFQDQFQTVLPKRPSAAALQAYTGNHVVASARSRHTLVSPQP